MAARRSEVFCPFCNAIGNAQRVLSPMAVLAVEGGRPLTAQPYCVPHFTYVCGRCWYAEIHDKVFLEQAGSASVYPGEP